MLGQKGKVLFAVPQGGQAQDPGSEPVVKVEADDLLVHQLMMSSRGRHHPGFFRSAGLDIFSANFF